RLSRSREGHSSAFKKATRERSSSSAAEYPSSWTEPSSVRSEQVPAPLNKKLRLQTRPSLHLGTSPSRPVPLVRLPLLPRSPSMSASARLALPLFQLGRPGARRSFSQDSR